jgi:hypothetical protein
LTEWPGSQRVRSPEVASASRNSAFSPELVLVSPELAAVARAAMAEPGEVRWGVFGFSVARGDATPARLRKTESASRPSAPEPSARDEQASPRLRLLMRRYGAHARSLAVLASIALALVLYPELHFTGAGGRPKVSSPPGVAQRQAEPVRLHWRSKAGATYYNVQIFRRGRKIFEAWPATPELTLAPRWTYGGRTYRLASAAYEWFVWPGFGARRAARYGELLQRDVFAVPAVDNTDVEDRA